jgi:hypothetical protein
MRARTSCRLKTELLRPRQPSPLANGVTPASARPSFTQDFSVPTAEQPLLLKQPKTGSRHVPLHALRHHRRPVASRPASAPTGPNTLCTLQKRANPLFFSLPLEPCPLHGAPRGHGATTHDRSGAGYTPLPCKARKKTREEKKGTHGQNPCETQARRARSHESP